MYVHEEKKVVFIAHPRTASSATAHVLMGMGFTIWGNHHSFDWWSRFEGWVVGCTVRNPFDVMVSWYHNKPREQSFDLWLPRFLSECHYFDNHLLFYGQPYATHRLQFETLQKDFDWFCGDTNLPLTKIPQRNVSVDRGKKHYMSFYDGQRANLVIERFRDDFVNNNFFPGVTSND